MGQFSVTNQSSGHLLLEIQCPAYLFYRKMNTQGAEQSIMPLLMDRGVWAMAAHHGRTFSTGTVFGIMV